MQLLSLKFIPSDLLNDSRDIEAGIKIAEQKLKEVTRSNGKTALDHAIAVCDILVDELGESDPNILIGALLHDLVEDTDVLIESVYANFGDAVGEIVKNLTPNKRSFYPSNAHKSRHKINMSLALLEKNYATRIIKCADKIHNLRSVQEIPENGHKYERIPYWIVEAQRAILPLASITSVKAYELIRDLTSDLKMEHEFVTL